MDKNTKKQSTFRKSDQFVAKNTIQKKWKRFPSASHYRTQAVNYEDESKGMSKLKKTAKLLKIQWWSWAWHYFISRFGKKWKFQDYSAYENENGIYELKNVFRNDGENENVKISLVGDWGSAIKEAYNIAEAVKKDSPHYTVHLGDIYYVGTKKEVKDNMLGNIVKWPLGSSGSFALNANHEMYAKGKGYFKYLLPSLGLRKGENQRCNGQKASFFCLKNDYWLVIGIDTGYNSIGTPIIEMIFRPKAELPNKLLEWIENDVQLQNDHQRGVIILSHHQYYSKFEKPYNEPARQLSNFLDRPILWFWGHEHRFAIYEKHATKKGKLEAYGRCIGHGGLPIEDIDDKPKEGKEYEGKLLFYDTRRKPEQVKDKHVGYNGYANLIFNNNCLTIDYKDEQQLLIKENWEVGNGGILKQKDTKLFVPEKNIVHKENNV